MVTCKDVEKRKYLHTVVGKITQLLYARYRGASIPREWRDGSVVKSTHWLLFQRRDSIPSTYMTACNCLELYLQEI